MFSSPFFCPAHPVSNEDVPRKEGPRHRSLTANKATRRNRNEFKKKQGGSKGRTFLQTVLHSYSPFGMLILADSSFLPGF